MTDADNTGLPPAYVDPEAYLQREHFHRLTTYTPTYAPDLPAHTVSYAVAGSLEPDAPTVVWLNGLGGHRLAATLLDGIFLAHGVRLVTLDRPAGGKSTPVPLPHRVRASFEALLAVLASEGISTFSLLSHSNGILYALYTLAHLPPHLTVRGWTLSSPYVPPWWSGSKLLAAARWIPAPLVAQLGIVAGVVQRLAGPLERGWGWSSAAVRDWGGWVSMGTAAASANAPRSSPCSSSADPATRPTTTTPESPAPAPTSASTLRSRRQQLERFRRLNVGRPAHQRLFGGESLPPGLFARGMQLVVQEGLDAMGQEAQLCLRLGGARWECPGEDPDDRGENEEAAGEDQGRERTAVVVDEQSLYERAFEALPRQWAAAGGRPSPLQISVWYGQEDALVPARGREYLRALLVDRLRLVDAERWHEVPEAGHDDLLGLSCVVEPLLLEAVQQGS